MVRYQTHLARSRSNYVLLLLAAICAIGFAACLAVDRYPRLETAFVVGAGASFSAALLTALMLLAKNRLPKTDLGGGEFAWRPKGSPLWAALLGGAGLVLVFVFGVLPRLMGVDLGIVMDVFAVLAFLVYGFLAYMEVRGKREDPKCVVIWVVLVSVAASILTQVLLAPLVIHALRNGEIRQAAQIGWGPLLSLVAAGYAVTVGVRRLRR